MYFYCMNTDYIYNNKNYIKKILLLPLICISILLEAQVPNNDCSTATDTWIK